MARQAAAAISCHSSSRDVSCDCSSDCLQPLTDTLHSHSHFYACIVASPVNAAASLAVDKLSMNFVHLLDCDTGGLGRTEVKTMAHFTPPPPPPLDQHIGYCRLVVLSFQIGGPEWAHDNKVRSIGCMILNRFSGSSRHD